MIDFAAARRAMVDCQVRPSDVTRYPIIAAMLSVAREEFVPLGQRDVAYAGDHIPLGPGRVVLDARTMGMMLDAADLAAGDLVLHVGTGLGYGAALMAQMADAVVALEEDAELAESAARVLAEQGVLNAIVELGSHLEGAPAHGPYDLVLFEGAVEDLPPAYLDQVKVGGRVVAIFSDGPVGQCRVGRRTDAGITWRRAFDATAPVLPGFVIEKSFEF